MLQNIDLSKILFLDVETVSQKSSFDELDETFQSLWTRKSRQFLKDNTEDPDAVKETYTDKAGIFSEFAKVVCISVGFLRMEGKKMVFRLKSFYGDDEAEVLRDFSNLLNKNYNNPLSSFLCGHNIKEFDIPYICRRLMIHQIVLPEMLQLSAKKPWETNMIDTMELWKFGDYKNYTSLNLLAAVLGIKTPKDDIDGSMVREVYYNEHDLPRITVYCQKDVLTTANIIMRFKGLPLIDDENIVIADIK